MNNTYCDCDDAIQIPYCSLTRASNERDTCLVAAELPSASRYSAPTQMRGVEELQIPKNSYLHQTSSAYLHAKRC